jgi:2-oxoglutarate ferredoxin oxidoreductase subunit beta
LVDIFQPCVTFNKVNTFRWFKEKTYYLKNHDYYNRLAAFEQAVQTEKLPLGIFYKHPGKETFEEGIKAYEVDKKPIIERIPDRQRLAQLIKAKR